MAFAKRKVQKAQESNAVAATVDSTELALSLGVIRHREGVFHGLWQLCRLNSDGSILHYIGGATTKNLVMHLASREISKLY